MSESDERELAEKIVNEVTLPPEIQRREVRSGRDSTGDPALWIVLWVDPKFQFSEEKAKILYRAAEEVQDRLMAGKLSRFPYVTVDQAA